ncbi:MAG: late competence development ComFB family protein [Pseudanabaenaceae cyanobacterium]
MSICKNAIEELVIAETEAQLKRLSPEVAQKIDPSDVIAYALNRLPPMYATSQRGWTELRERASKALKTQIESAVRHALVNTQKDPLRQADPIPQEELATQARSLLRLQKILCRDNLSWKEVPDLVQEALRDPQLYRSLRQLGTSYLSIDRRSAFTVKNYLKRRQEKQNPAAVQQETKEFKSYMSGANYTYTNVLENLVTTFAEHNLQRLPPAIQQQIKIEDVIAYTLNRLPPMYATSGRGVQQLRQRIKSEMLNEVLGVLKQGFTRVIQSPARMRLPLPMERFNAEQEEALARLKQILGRSDLTWRNLPDVVEEMLLSPRVHTPPQ